MRGLPTGGGGGGRGGGGGGGRGDLHKHSMPGRSTVNLPVSTGILLEARKSVYHL